jgi:phosphoribosylformylglycinamidine synthase
MAKALSLPFVSGNVSFYNESIKTAVPPTPEIVGIGIVPDIRKCITSSIKEQGNSLYLIGKSTEKEMGGSEYYRILKREGGTIPRTDARLLKTCIDGILTTIEKEYITSCHDLSEGGLGICLSEMIIGGDIGGTIDLSKMNAPLRSDIKFFSETNTRWIVEVKKHKESDFKHLFNKKQVPHIHIGKTGGDTLTIREKNTSLATLEINDLRVYWKNPLWDVMG